MEVSAIGGNVSSAATGNSNSTISQDEFIKLFLAQLNFQDPLEPVDNREFLTQMAQFSQLEVERNQEASLGNLVAMNSSDQGVSLLGKTVDVTQNQSTVTGTVEAVHFSQTGTTITVKQADGTPLTNVPLGQIRVVQ